jgi:hypothetical protein
MHTIIHNKTAQGKMEIKRRIHEKISGINIKINIVYSFVRKSHKLPANWSKASI